MNKLSVFSFSYRPRFYVKHPIRFIKDVFFNIKSGWRRACYGYCSADIWDIDMWFLDVFPAMLRDLATNGCGYPGDCDTPEQWKDKLNSIADVLESLQEENWFAGDSSRYQEKYVERQELLENTFKELSKIFFSLWD